MTIEVIGPQVNSSASRFVLTSGGNNAASSARADLTRFVAYVHGSAARCVCADAGSATMSDSACQWTAIADAIEEGEEHRDGIRKRYRPGGPCPAADQGQTVLCLCHGISGRSE